MFHVLIFASLLAIASAAPVDSPSDFLELTEGSGESLTIVQYNTDAIQDKTLLNVDDSILTVQPAGHTIEIHHADHVIVANNVQVEVKQENFVEQAVSLEDAPAYDLETYAEIEGLEEKNQELRDKLADKEDENFNQREEIDGLSDDKDDHEELKETHEDLLDVLSQLRYDLEESEENVVSQQHTIDSLQEENEHQKRIEHFLEAIAKLNDNQKVEETTKTAQPIGETAELQAVAGEDVPKARKRVLEKEDLLNAHGELVEEDYEQNAEGTTIYSWKYSFQYDD